MLPSHRRLSSLLQDPAVPYMYHNVHVAHWEDIPPPVENIVIQGQVQRQHCIDQPHYNGVNYNEMNHVPPAPAVSITQLYNNGFLSDDEFPAQYLAAPYVRHVRDVPAQAQVHGLPAPASTNLLSASHTHLTIALGDSRKSDLSPCPSAC
jgi:hypothetical protein